MMAGDRRDHADQGERGDQGLMGVAGERGPKGDHGQDGRQGQKGATGDSEKITTWFGWTRWRWATIAFVGFVLVAAFSTWRAQEVAKKFTERLVLSEKEQGVQRARANCEVSNNLTNRIRTLVAAATSGQVSVDYTALPEFQLLSKNEQNFFLALRKKSQTEGNAAARAEFMKGLDLRDCDLEFPVLPPPKVKG